MAGLNELIDTALSSYSKETATAFEADIFSFMGGIRFEYLAEFRAKIEQLADNKHKSDNLAVFLYTPGGLTEMAEKMVDIMRKHYKEVWFVVPDMAMSAGTILCMSGDKIYMDYSSSLGPIDPQVVNSKGVLVPALGYLDQVQKMIKKSEEGNLTDAEFVILQNQDLAMLRRYEQARDLSISLLKKWLVQYKFKDWAEHSSSRDEVTIGEKENRAVEIAEALTDHNKWNSHGRLIGINTLTKELKLRIEDYTECTEKKHLIRQYSGLLIDCMESRNVDHFFHSQQLTGSL